MNLYHKGLEDPTSMTFVKEKKLKEITKMCTNCIKQIFGDHLIEICTDCFTL